MKDDGIWSLVRDQIADDLQREEKLLAVAEGEAGGLGDAHIGPPFSATASDDLAQRRREMNWLEEAEQLARTLRGERYDILRGRLLDPATKSVSRRNVPSRELPLRAAAGPPGYLLREGPTSGDYAGEANAPYRLEVAEKRSEKGRWSTAIEMRRPYTVPDRDWAFRLEFESAVEAKALRDLGFRPETLAALRGHCGKDEAWQALLDLLLPYRFGSSDDPVHDLPMRQALEGRLPAQPLRVSFWLLPLPEDASP